MSYQIFDERSRLQRSALLPQEQDAWQSNPIAPRRGGRMSLLSIVCAINAASASAQTSVMLIPPFGGDQYMNPYAVSDDGNTIVGHGGTGNFCHQRPFLWTAVGGTRVLPLFVGDTCTTPPYVWAISGDGSYAAGHTLINNAYHHAVRWSLTGIPAIEDLGVIGGTPSSTHSRATGLNASGSVVVCISDGCCNGHAGRWSDGVMTPLEDCNDCRYGGDAAACNADGTVIVGRITYPLDQAVRWVAGSPRQLLGFLPGMQQSAAAAVDASGTVVVGRSFTASGTNFRAFRWTPHTGMVALPLLPGSTDSEATAVSDDGLVVGGRVFGNGVNRTVLWTADERLIDVTCVIQAAGVSLVGLANPLTNGVTGLSADGHVLVGTDRNGFRIQLDNFDAAPNVTAQPESAVACVSGSQTFSVSASGQAELSYRWRKDGTPIDTAANPTASTANLVLDNLQQQDIASYDCLVTNSCGSALSQSAVLSLCACLACSADFNQDGGIDGADVSLFFDRWEVGHCDADVNADGGTDGADFDTFFAAWEAGGCG